MYVWVGGAISYESYSKQDKQVCIYKKKWKNTVWYGCIRVPLSLTVKLKSFFVFSLQVPLSILTLNDGLKQVHRIHVWSLYPHLVDFIVKVSKNYYTCILSEGYTQSIPKLGVVQRWIIVHLTLYLSYAGRKCKALCSEVIGWGDLR